MTVPNSLVVMVPKLKWGKKDNMGGHEHEYGKSKLNRDNKVMTIEAMDKGCWQHTDDVSSAVMCCLQLQHHNACRLPVVDLTTAIFAVIRR